MTNYVRGSICNDHQRVTTRFYALLKESVVACVLGREHVVGNVDLWACEGETAVFSDPRIFGDLRICLSRFLPRLVLHSSQTTAGQWLVWLDGCSA